MLRSPLDQYFLLGVMLATLICTMCTDESDTGALRWNKAHGLWGKRSLLKETANNEEKRVDDALVNMESPWVQRYGPPSQFIDWEKRSQWQLANGLWGRRR